MFFHRNISHGWVPPALSTEEQLGCRLKKEKPSFTPSKVLLMFEYLFLIRKVHFEEATGVGVMCVCVCARALHASEQTSEGAGRKMVLSRLRTRRPVYSSGFFSFSRLLPCCHPSLVWVPESLPGKLFRKLLPPISSVLVFRADGPE